MKRFWIAAAMIVGLFVGSTGFGVTLPENLVQAEGTIDYVTASSVSRAQSEVQIRKLKQLLISKKAEDHEQAAFELEKMQQD